MADKKLKIVVIGLGPIGSIISAHLSKAGAEVYASDLPYRIQQLNRDGIQIVRDGALHQYNIKTVDSIKELTDIKPDFVLVALKASILDRVMPDVAASVNDNCTFLSVQNGIGTEDKIAAYISPESVCRMVVNYAGGNDATGLTTFNWFNPPNYLGPHLDSQNAKLEMIVDMLNSVGLASECVESKGVKEKAFLKTVLNAALMPLCAVLNLTMRQAMQTEVTRKIAIDVLKEGFAVGERLGYDYGENILQTSIEYLDKGGDHHPSMSTDIHCQVPTEIEFINGKILELGSHFDGLDLSTNRVLVSLVMTHEVMNGSRNPGCFPEYVL